MTLARYYVRGGRLPEAIWEYQEVAASRPDDLASQEDLASALGRLGLTGIAISRLETQARRAPSLRRELAEIHMRAGHPQRAVEVLTADQSGATSPPGVGVTLGRAYLALGRLAAAREAFLMHARAEPGDAEAGFWLGRVAWVSGQAAAARRHWQRAADAAPSDPRFPYSLALSHAGDGASGSVDRAGQAFDEALRRDPRYAPAFLQLGLLFHRHRRFRDAARHFLQAIEISPASPEPHRRLAETLAALGEQAEAHRRRGLYYSLSHQPLRAFVEYERLQSLDPDGIDAPILLSQSAIQMQQNEQAVAVLEQALKRHPRHPALSERLATLYVLIHSPKEAEAVCHAWLQGDPRAARAHWVLGRAAFSDHRIEDAIRHYEAALSLQPDDADLHAGIAGALELSGRPADRPRALTHLRRAVELGPAVPDTHYRLGVAYEQHGEWEPARQELLAALRLDPAHAGAYNSLTQVAQGLRQPHQVRLWSAALRAVQERRREETRLRLQVGAHPRDPAAWFALAHSLLRGGALEKAQGALEQSLWLRPGWPEARRALERLTALRAVL